MTVKSFDHVNFSSAFDSLNVAVNYTIHALHKETKLYYSPPEILVVLRAFCRCHHQILLLQHYLLRSLEFPWYLYSPMHYPYKILHPPFSLAVA